MEEGTGFRSDSRNEMEMLGAPAGLMSRDLTPPIDGADPLRASSRSLARLIRLPGERSGWIETRSRLFRALLHCAPNSRHPWRPKVCREATKFRSLTRMAALDDNRRPRWSCYVRIQPLMPPFLPDVSTVASCG